MHPILRSAIVFLAVVGFSRSVSAQMFSYGGHEGRATQSLALTSYLIDFTFDGSGELPSRRLDWNGTAYGVSFNRRNFSAAVVLGSTESIDGPGSDRLKLFDATLSGWAEIVRSRGSTSTVGVPIVIHSGFRSVDGDFSNNVSDSFSYTTLGIGTGVAAALDPTPAVSFEAHAWPVIAMVFRSFEGYAGTSTMLDTDFQVHFMNLFGRYGLSAGYGYRWQKWSTKDVLLVTNVSQDIFDYKSSQHMLRLGLNW